MFGPIARAHDELDMAGVFAEDGSRPLLVERVRLLCDQRDEVRGMVKNLRDELAKLGTTTRAHEKEIVELLGRVVERDDQLRDRDAKIGRLKANAGRLKAQRDILSRAHDVLDEAGVFDADGSHPQLVERIRMLVEREKAAGKPKQDCCCGWDAAAPMPSETVLSISGGEFDCAPEVITLGDVRYVPERNLSAAAEAFTLELLDLKAALAEGRAEHAQLVARVAGAIAAGDVGFLLDDEEED